MEVPSTCWKRRTSDVLSLCRKDKNAVRQTISATSEPDLFWGMRGAGGSLGVAIEYTTHTFAIPEKVCILTLLLCMEVIWHCNGL